MNQVMLLIVQRYFHFMLLTLYQEVLRDSIYLSQVSKWYLTLPSLTPREVLILLLREVCSLSLAVSPASCASTRGVSARGLGVTPVSWTTDSESNVPGRRPWLQNTTLNILFVSYINIFSIFCILEVCAVFAVHYIKKSIKAE